MATAAKKYRGPSQVASRAAEVHGAPTPMEFHIFEDNGGAHHWRILAGDGATLGQSGDIASYDEAVQAAQQVRDGAASARFERRDAASGDSDAESRAR
jgi:uncharacterized protein YegP (UPF0339 family)